MAIVNIAWKVSKYGVFSGPYFPAFRVITERYGVSLRIQSECGKIRTRKNSVFGNFSRSETCIISAPQLWINIHCMVRVHCKNFKNSGNQFHCSFKPSKQDNVNDLFLLNILKYLGKEKYKYLHQRKCKKHIR